MIKKVTNKVLNMKLMDFALIIGAFMWLDIIDDMITDMTSNISKKRLK